MSFLQRFHLHPLVLGLLLALTFAGCSSKHWRNSADREAARLIREKTPAVPNMDTNFTAEPKPPAELATLPLAPEPGEFLGPDAEAERGARMLDLATALDLAVRQSREFQTRREVLFLESLDLSLSRHRFTPIFGADGNASFTTTTPITVIHTNSVGQTVTGLRNGDQIARGRMTFGLNWLLATGTRLSADFTADFLRFVSGGSGQTVSSRLSGSLVQPLLRGAGFKATLESLKQSERDLLYALREFAQYRQTFAVTTAGDYYQVLQARDTARNAFLDLQRSRRWISSARPN